MSWQQPQDSPQPQPQPQVPQWGTTPPQVALRQAPAGQQSDQPESPPFYTPQPYEKQRRRINFRIVIGVAIVLALGFGDWAFNYVHTVQRGDGGTITHAGTVDVTSLQIGDCFNGASTGVDLSSVTGVPCTQAHSGQVLGSVPMTDTTYPSQSDLTTEANSACKVYWDRLPSTLPSDASGGFLFPASETDFDAGDTTITCLLASSTQDLTDSYVTD